MARSYCAVEPLGSPGFRATIRSNSGTAAFQSPRDSASIPSLNRSSTSRAIAKLRRAGTDVVRGNGVEGEYVCAVPAVAVSWARRATRSKTRIAHGVLGSAGSSASCARADAAARSGLHSQPTRPAEVIGPSRAGAAEGASAPSSISWSEAAPAKAKRPQNKAPVRSAAASTRRTRVLDTLSIIAESLKNP
jgi:hypothetical protein